MPLTKAQKALYEAALRRKGLQPGKAVRQDPRRAKLDGEWLPADLKHLEAELLLGPELPASQIRNSRRRARYLAKKEADRQREELEA